MNGVYTKKETHWICAVAAEWAQTISAGELKVAETMVVHGQAEAERFRQTQGLRGWVMRWLVQ